jgi:hypothetical protein
MIAIEIDETTQAGQSILHELAQHPEAGKMKEFVVPCDENGDPIGAPWEDVLENIYEDLSEHYGVDLRTL